MDQNPSSFKDKDQNLQELVQKRGEEIFAMSAKVPTKSFFSKDFWYGRIMEWSMKNEKFKTQMFRFVDVLPYLNSGSEVARHLKEYFAEGGEKLPSIFNFGVGMGSLAPGLMAGAVRKNITQMAKMFISGETPKEALAVITKARKNGLSFTVDLLGEATLSEKEALEYQRKYIDLIEWLSADAKKWSGQKQTDENHLGPIPKVNVSVKLTSLYSQIHLEAWQESIDHLKERLRPILRKAIEHDAFINLDMEQYSVKDMTLEVFKQLLTEEEFKDYPHWGIVIQAYLRSSLKDIADLVEFSKTRGVPFTVRLVKGAYWDYETVASEQKGWPYPVFTVKKESDACFENCAQLILENHQHIHLAIGSHNVRSISAALVNAEKLGIDKKAIEIQMLFGMADSFKLALVGMGYRVREYTPVGELIPGMAYLVRRLLENTSNESFLKSKFADGAETLELMKNPQEGLQASSSEVSPSGTFDNESPFDFSMSLHRNHFKSALQEVQGEFDRHYPLHIDGKDLKTERTLESRDPSERNRIVGTVSVASEKEAEMAVQAARQASLFWKKTDVTKRLQVIENLISLLRRDRYKLAALEVYEAGKGWKEADGDITEAIDFCRYYAEDMRKLSRPQKDGSVPGEVNLYSYQAKGVVLVISPWNFPLAILTGMVAAAVVSGNTVIMKPAEQTSVIAAKLMELLQEAGLPSGVVNYLPGYGEEVGEYLVNHKDIDLISFTGSKAVGLGIIAKAGITHPGQRNVKTCIVEMGGKNALIVDSDADLDEAIAGVIYSAFGFQGQKCSACSRVIVLEENYDRFLERLIESVSSVEVRPSTDPTGYLGPVIDQEAFDRITGQIERAKEHSKLVFQGEVPEGGYFIAPTVFADVDPKSPLAQEEIFGPVLAVIKAKDIDHALEIANDTEYALTGGLYSRSPANIEKVKEQLNVGNLYINRNITGAMVHRHPFGGFKMSGTGCKTGGPDYLKQFMEAKLVSENTLRRGFAPSEEEGTQEHPS